MSVTLKGIADSNVSILRTCLHKSRSLDLPFRSATCSGLCGIPSASLKAARTSPSCSSMSAVQVEFCRMIEIRS